MALKRKTRSWLKVGGMAAVVVIGYDLYKAHTGGPAPSINPQRVKSARIL